MRHKEWKHEIVVGDGIVTVREKGQSALRVANILGTESCKDGTTYFLDRLVFRPGDRDLTDEWSASGCVSTVLFHRNMH